MMIGLKKMIKWIHLGAVVSLIYIPLVQIAVAESQDPARIVVLPFYTTEEWFNLGEEWSMHPESEIVMEGYGRITQAINNQLMYQSLEIISPVAGGEKNEYNHLRERVYKNLPLVAQEMASKYGANIIHIVWFNVSERLTNDGYCQAQVQLKGESYDSTGYNVRTDFKIFRVTRQDCELAVIEAKTKAGNEFGHNLFNWLNGPKAQALLAFVVERASTTLSINDFKQQWEPTPCGT